MRSLEILAAWLVILACQWMAGTTAPAQILAYPDPCLDFIYPAGGCQGGTVQVQLGGTNGLAGATEVLVEGGGGITVRDVRAVSAGEVQATFEIAADAPLGRRRVRVLGGTNGLTNFRYFHVGRLPTVVESEPNDARDSALEVALPLVVDGRMNPELDVDWFRFQARAGQEIVCAVLAHGMDSKLRPSFNMGFLDTSLEVQGEDGSVLASAEDTVGLDPVLSFKAPRDGLYFVSVRALSFKGDRGAVYRLTLGDVPYPTRVFPNGGQRGTQVEVEWFGPHVPAGTRTRLSIDADSFPVQSASLPGATEGLTDLPLLRSDCAEGVEMEPNGWTEQAQPLEVPSAIHGRLAEPGDEDWFRLQLAAGDGVLLQTTAQRYMRSKADTVIELFDASGKMLAANDDAPMFAGECAHDFESSDSWLTYTASAPGDFLVRVRDAGGASGESFWYRLLASRLEPDFQLYQWPDAVPVWGAGTSATLVVQIFHWGGLADDVELRVDGLPDGWRGSVANVPAAAYTMYAAPYGFHSLLTITAPADAAPGTRVPFRVWGRCTLATGQVIEHEARYQTLYGNSHNDRMFLRDSPGASAVVAGAQDAWLETTVTELTMHHGQTLEIPVTLHRTSDSQAEIGISIDGPTPGVGCAWRTPMTVKYDQQQVLLPFTLASDWRPGVYSVVVSRAWSSDLRVGRPGPCTPLIRLRVLPALP